MSKLYNKLYKSSSILIALILVLVPIWPFVSVWLSSGIGHYTAIRLAIEVILLLLMLLAAGLLISQKGLAKNLIAQKWFWPLAAFVVLEVVWGLVAYFTDAVSAKALGYGWIVDLRYMLFFIIIFITAGKSNFLGEHWRRLIFIPAAVVAIFAVLQFAVLPLNFMSHFGYNAQTIFPYQTINHNHSLPRAMSFTRGANPLGAYMVIIFSLGLMLLLRAKAQSAKLLYGGYTILGFLALFVSFSRSAWLGAAVSFVLVFWLALTGAKSRKIMLACLAGLIIISAGLFVGLRNNPTVQSYFLHTRDGSTSKISSNEGHVDAFKRGIKNVAADPLGNGPGTAGPASVYNDDGPGRIYENYYLMIANENGWLGLIILLAFFVLVAVELYKRKTDLSLALLAILIGLMLANFFLPAWTDITLAYVFWGLAGFALAVNTAKIKPNGRKTNKPRHDKANQKTTITA